MPDRSKTYYTLLGVLRDASAEDIRRAYFELAQQLHPDKNKLAGETELFLDVQQAYEVLSNPQRRAQYAFALQRPETADPRGIGAGSDADPPCRGHSAGLQAAGHG